MIRRAVVQFSFLPANGSGFIKGGSWKLTLACGHVEYRKSSTTIPRVAKCRECTCNAALRKAKRDGTLNVPPERDAT